MERHLAVLDNVNTLNTLAGFVPDSSGMRKSGTSYRWSVTQFQRAAVSSGVLPANNPSLSWACSWHTLWRFPPIYRSPTHSVIFLLPALQAKSVLLAKRLPKDHSGGSSKSVTWEGWESLNEIQVSEHAESTVKNVYFLFVVNLPHCDPRRPLRGPGALHWKNVPVTIFVSGNYHVIVYLVKILF